MTNPQQIRYNYDTETGARVMEKIVVRKKKDESFVPVPTPERQLESPSGFCITEHHENCPHQFNHGICGCICHKEKK